MESIVNRERMITFLLQTPVRGKLEPAEIRHYARGEVIFCEG